MGKFFLSIAWIVLLLSQTHTWCVAFFGTYNVEKTQWEMSTARECQRSTSHPNPPQPTYEYKHLFLPCHPPWL